MCKLFGRDQVARIHFARMMNITPGTFGMCSHRPREKERERKKNTVMFDRKHFSCFIYLFLEMATRYTL